MLRRVPRDLGISRFDWKTESTSPTRPGQGHP
jgi:hypothetical protein